MSPAPGVYPLIGAEHQHHEPTARVSDRTSAAQRPYKCVFPPRHVVEWLNNPPHIISRLLVAVLQLPSAMQMPTVRCNGNRTDAQFNKLLMPSGIVVGLTISSLILFSRPPPSCFCVVLAVSNVSGGVDGFSS